jgi:hypothetical protein
MVPWCHKHAGKKRAHQLNLGASRLPTAEALGTQWDYSLRPLTHLAAAPEADTAPPLGLLGLFADAQLMNFS